MTAPDYKFNDERLKAYLDYLQYVIDPMTDELNGISMSVELSSDFTSYKTLKVNDVYAEMPSVSGLNAYLSRTGADLTLYDEARLIVHLIDDGAGMPNYAVEYSIDDGASWDFLDGVAGPYVEAYPDPEPFVFTGAWVTIDALAKTNIWMRLVGKNDEGTPAIRNSRVGIVSVEFRTLWSFEDPVMTYDERIQYLSDNQLPPFD